VLPEPFRTIIISLCAFFFPFPLLYIGFAGWGMLTWLAMLGYLSASFFVAVWFNNARQHQRPEAFDDKSYGSEKWRQALENVESGYKEKRRT